MDPIQGTNAILSFYKNEFVPFLCSSDVGVSLDVDEISSRTSGDGAWKKTVYQTIGYSVSLSGVLVFDTGGMNGWELIKNQISFLTIPFRISYTDAGGLTKSLQGICSIKSSQLSAAVGDVVKGSFSLTGQGALAQFDGIVPCPSAVTGITVDTTGTAGDASVTYSYTGDVYQVKYRLNGAGDYGYALGGEAIDIPGLAIGDYTIEIIPICTNGFAGTGFTQAFAITRGAVCSSVITNIIVTIASTVTATNTHTGSATQMRYRIDGGAWIMALIDAVINMTGVSPGNHTIEEQPMCQFGTGFVAGTGFTRDFTIVSTPTMSPLNYSFVNNSRPFITCLFQIYVNGILQIGEGGTDSGNFTVPIGATVKASVTASGTLFIPATLIMNVKDVTTGVIMHNETQNKGTLHSQTINYSFTNDADTHLITLTVNP